MTTSNPTACLIIIGNEILSGRTQDANLAFLGHELNALGIRMTEARVIVDDEDAIVRAVNETRARYTYVFTTGGIGPTHDDITSASIAKAFGLPFGRNEEAYRRLVAFYPPEKLNAARARMADTPEGAILIDNPVSIAPGFQVENVFVLPGVPRIMQGMFDGLKSRLAGGQPVLSRTVVCECGEGDLAARLGEIQDAHAGLEIGSYPFMRVGRPGTSVVFRGTDRVTIDTAAALLEAHAEAHGVTIDRSIVT